MHTRANKQKITQHLNITNSIEVIGVARGGGGGEQGARNPPNRNATYDKNVKKVLFLDFQFLLASSRTTVHAYNTNYQIILTTRRPGPHQFNFANQLKCITRVKLRGFVLKVATSGPHLIFYERNTITRAGFTISHSARTPRSDGKNFFWSSRIFGRKTLQKSSKYQWPRAM